MCSRASGFAYRRGWLVERRHAISVHPAEPTPYPDVNAVVNELLSGVQSVLGACLVGMYLIGSLAGGDFDPQRSDVDFLVVTEDELTGEALAALQAMHVRMRSKGGPWVSKLEGGYVPRSKMRRYDASQARHPWLGSDGHFAVEQFGSDWVIQCHVMREHAIVLAGPQPRSLMHPILPDDLRRAQRATLREWWAPQLQDVSRLRSREYQAYAVLTMCRALYTLEHGDVAPKRVAARWAQQTLEPRWPGLIDRALAWPCGQQPDELDETLDFVRYTLERAGQSADEG